MKKLRLVFFLVTGMMLFAGCNVRGKIEKMDKAKADSEFIMNNLNKPAILDKFPEKYFPKAQTQAFIDTLTNRCDFDTKNGKFVDFFTMSINGTNKTAYIYEYFLNCDSLRFIYIYDFDTKEPELQNLKIEGLEVGNKMIIDLSKQLLNSGTK